MAKGEEDVQDKRGGVERRGEGGSGQWRARLQGRMMKKIELSRQGGEKEEGALKEGN